MTHSLTIVVMRYKLGWLRLSLLMLTSVSLCAGCSHSSAVMKSSRNIPQEKHSAQESVSSETSKVNMVSGVTPVTFIPTNILFSRNNFIYLQNLKTREIKRIVRGDEPSLYPVGNSIAFTYIDKESDKFWSTLKVFDLQTLRTKEFPSLTDIISYNPQWSPDGTNIAFENKSGIRWGVGLLNPKSGEWQSLTKNLPTDTDFFLSSWTANSKSVICHDLNYIYEINMEGDVLQKILIATVNQSTYGISSDTKFSFSRDMRYLLFNSAAEPERNAAIFIFDFKEQKLSRITPESINGSEPKWLPSGREVLFLITKKRKGEYIHDVCKISIGSDNYTTLIENASSATLVE